MTIREEEPVRTQAGPMGVEKIVDARRHAILAMLCIIAVVNMIDRQIITILLDPIKEEFGASDAAMGLLTGMIFALFYAGASIPLARWADLGQRRVVISVCLGFWSIMTTLGGVAQSFLQLAITRVGVAVGESGASPTSQSILSDLYPLGSRATALAILSGCSSIGIGMGVLLGGWLSDTFSWRVAFFIVGAPGIALAIVVFYFLPEPKRGGADGLVDDKSSPKFIDVFLQLGKIPTYRCLVLIAAFVALCGYGSLMWGPTFLGRVHGLSQTQIGFGFGLTTAAALLLGNVGSGVVADWAGKHDIRWYMRISGLGPALGFPFGLLFVFAPSATISLVGYFFFQFFITFHIPSVNAITQTLAPLRMRAMASVIVSLFQTFVGIGLAPLLIGSVNDLLEPVYGQGAVRYSLAIVMTGAAAAGVTGFLATIWIRKDHADSVAKGR